MSEEYPDKADELFLEIHRIFCLQSVEAGMARLAEVVQNLEGFSDAEQEHLKNWHLIWTRALDLNYRPPHPSHELEVSPLWLRYTYCVRNQPAEAERTLWTYVQHCAFGTKAFQDALTMLVEFAVSSNNFPLARHAAEILLHHYAILNLVRFNPLMPVGEGEPSEKHEWPDDLTPLYLPYGAAIEALEEDPAQCWLTILELELEITPIENRTERFYTKVQEALRRYYSKTGNAARLEWLKAYEVE